MLRYRKPIRTTKFLRRLGFAPHPLQLILPCLETCPTVVRKSDPGDITVAGNIEGNSVVYLASTGGNFRNAGNIDGTSLTREAVSLSLASRLLMNLNRAIRSATSAPNGEVSSGSCLENTPMDIDDRKKQKRIDLPPKGSRNADPITDAPGSHPIEAGIGAAIAGAASGLAAGAVAGPLVAAASAAVGAVVGGYAGKGVGEIIDPTTEDDWLRDHFESFPYPEADETFATYEPAYRYGGEVEAKYGDAGWDAIMDDVEKDWAQSEGYPGMKWPKAREAVKKSYERTVQIRKDRSHSHIPDSVPEH
jgi:hypothetical protein